MNVFSLKAFNEASHYEGSMIGWAQLPSESDDWTLSFETAVKLTIEHAIIE